MAASSNQVITIQDVCDIIEKDGVYIITHGMTTVAWHKMVSRKRRGSLLMLRRFIRGTIPLEALLSTKTTEPNVVQCIVMSTNSGFLEKIKSVKDKRIKVCHVKNVADLVPHLAACALTPLTFNMTAMPATYIPRTPPPNQHDMILPNLHLGSKDAYHVLPSGTTHVVSATHTVTEPPNDIPLERFFHINEHDNGKVNIYKYFDNSSKFIHDAIQSGGTVLVHCDAGISRSVTIVCAYLIKYHDKSYKEALDMVQSKRRCADPNFTFHASLIRYSSEIVGEARTNISFSWQTEPEPLCRCPPISPMLKC